MISANPHVSTCSCSSCKVDNNSTDMALISVAIRKKTSNNNNNFKTYLEYGSLAIIFILGLFLLII